MKRIIFVLLVYFTMIPNVFSQDFYDIDTINNIEIIFTETNWDEILDSLYAVGNEERLIGTAIINGVQYDSVGIRYKGNSSYNPNRIKNPLNIKLDHIIDDQLIDGYGTLKLANCFKDPSFVREVLSYEIARNYLPAVKANFINVYINGNLIGLYTSVQSVDKFFLENNFYCNDNAFFKGELTNLPPQEPVVVWGCFGPDSTNYFNYYELKSDTGWSDLIEFLDTFNNNTATVEDVLNVDRHLWMLAFDILMVNLDAPVNFGHNYYLYKDDAGQFNPIMWDLNENFGGFGMLLGGGQPLNIIQMQQLDPFLYITHPNYPIINKILPNTTYQKMYIAHVKTIMEDFFSNDWYLTKALEIQNIIDADVQADPNKLYSYSDFLKNIYNLVGSGRQSIVGITQLMDARVTFLTNHPAFRFAAPDIGNISNTPVNIIPYSNVWINVEVNNANSVMLGYRHSILDKFEKIQMFDDGSHNDGAAGDGIYGVSVSTSNTDIQYYIYAGNNDAAMFSPERAEYEYYTLRITGNLVINEFMAINDATIPDRNGEYDDWVELYNNTDTAISLNGYYLSDDGSNLTRWAFPDTLIAANDYLIIWTDNDVGQAGLHTNFKLSGSGETVILVDSSQAVVDEVVFGQQTADISSGRYPNGMGPFIAMSPTFSVENVDGITGIKKNPTPTLSTFTLYQNYPNPFNPQTTISYQLPVNANVTINIYNMLGQEVRTLINENKSAGYHSVVWNGKDNSGQWVTSGIYFYQLKTGSDLSETKRMMLLK